METFRWYKDMFLFSIYIFKNCNARHWKEMFIDGYYANRCPQRGIHEINEEEYSPNSSYIFYYQLQKNANETDLKISS